MNDDRTYAMGFGETRPGPRNRFHCGLSLRRVCSVLALIGNVEAMAKKHVQVIKVKDYGDHWINRLAVILDTLAKMEPREREVSLEFIVAKYLKRS
jgi:hypothetical protein